MLSLPRTTAPAARSRATAVASYGGTKRSRILEPHVVRMPRVHRTSLSATGTPSSGPRGAPARKRASAASAWASAASRVTVRNARTCPSRASMRARWARAASVGVTSPARKRRASSDRPSSVSAATSPSLLDDLRHPEEVAVGIGGVGQHVGEGERGPRVVVAQHVGQGHGVGGGLDALDIAAPPLFNVHRHPLPLPPPTHL